MRNLRVNRGEEQCEEQWAAMSLRALCNEGNVHPRAWP